MHSIVHPRLMAAPLSFIGVVITITLVLTGTSSSDGGNGVLAVNTRNRTADEVTTIPGWSPKPVPAKMYSGYLDNGAGGYLHYLWQFPQNSSLNLATAPITIWSNGGPGCASFADGAFYENGMFQMFFRNVTNPATPGATPMDLNPYAWNLNAHVVYFTHSAGVGPAFASSDEALRVDDKTDAERNFYALQQLFTYKFPEYKNNPIWLAGESYFGIYSMLWTEQILNYLDAGYTDLFQNFKGVLVGNGVTDDAYDGNLAYSTALFAHGHGMITGNTFQQIVDDCIATPDSDECQSHWEIVPASLNIYGFTQWCYNPASLQQREQSKRAEVVKETKKVMMNSDYRFFEGFHARGRRGRISARQSRRMKNIASLEHDLSFSSSNQQLQSYTPAEQQYMNTTFPGFTPVFGQNYYALDCTDEYYVMDYFSRNDVKMAFNLPLNFNMTVCWTLPYQKVVSDVVPIYERLRQRANVTIVIYNGIQDMIVPYTGTWSWMQNHGWKQLSDYQPWTYVDKLRPAYGVQTGGWVMRIGTPNTYFVSTRTAGHMSPEVENAPAATFEMFQRAINNNLWDVPLYPDPVPFKGQFINPNRAPSSTSMEEKGKWIGIGFAICVGVLALVLIVLTLVNNNNNKKGNQQTNRQFESTQDGGLYHEH